MGGKLVGIVAFLTKITWNLPLFSYSKNAEKQVWIWLLKWFSALLTMRFLLGTIIMFTWFRKLVKLAYEIVPSRN